MIYHLEWIMAFYSRKSPRAQRYDYSAEGMYFVTICTKGRIHYFGTIIEKKMILSDIGKICDQEFAIMLEKRPGVEVHAYCIMPNHVHLLLYITDYSDTALHHSMYVNECRDSGLPCPSAHPIVLSSSTMKTRKTHINNHSLGSVIGGWKSAVSRASHQQGLDFAWQDRYHDHIVRKELDYENIKHYIESNPLQREQDTHRTEQ